MKLFKLFTSLTVLFFLSNCSNNTYGPSGGNFLGDYFPGEWDYPTSIGKNRYLLRGYGTREAITGAKNHCRTEEMEMINLIPPRGRTMAVITFKCVPKK
tara:strand:+ start:236 stop:532 length:297 start_codon:yes stop_codon:yes gene_type:complete